MFDVVWVKEWKNQGWELAWSYRKMKELEYLENKKDYPLVMVK